MTKSNFLIKAIVIVMPWKIKRIILQSLYGYDLASDAKIGIAWFFPKHLKMGSKSRIDHFNIAIHLDLVDIGCCSFIGRSNWITGFPSGTNSKHFEHQKHRKSILRIGRHSAITKNHHLDCTNLLSIGDFSTIAGYHSQFLTHSINIEEGRQDSNPIEIGDYCFVGTRATVLGGAKLPSYSVLAAGALLNKAYSEEFYVYGGVPAKPIKQIPGSSKYMTRAEGFVY